MSWTACRIVLASETPVKQRRHSLAPASRPRPSATGPPAPSRLSPGSPHKTRPHPAFFAPEPPSAGSPAACSPREVSPADFAYAFSPREVSSADSPPQCITPARSPPPHPQLLSHPARSPRLHRQLLARPARSPPPHPQLLARPARSPPPTSHPSAPRPRGLVRRLPTCVLAGRDLAAAPRICEVARRSAASQFRTWGAAPPPLPAPPSYPANISTTHTRPFASRSTATPALRYSPISRFPRCDGLAQIARCAFSTLSDVATFSPATRAR